MTAEHLLMLCLCAFFNTCHVCNTCRIFSYFKLFFVSNSLARFVQLTLLSYLRGAVQLIPALSSLRCEIFSQRTGSSNRQLLNFVFETSTSVSQCFFLFFTEQGKKDLVHFHLSEMPCWMNAKQVHGK